MKSVDIGAVAPESLPDVSGMAFDTSLPREERIALFLQAVENPYCFCIGGIGVKIEFAESGPSLQDTLTDFLLRQKRAVTSVTARLLLRDKVSRSGGILVVLPGQSYNISVM